MNQPRHRNQPGCPGPVVAHVNAYVRDTVIFFGAGVLGASFLTMMVRTPSLCVAVMFSASASAGIPDGPGGLALTRSVEV